MLIEEVRSSESEQESDDFDTVHDFSCTLKECSQQSKTGTVENQIFCDEETNNFPQMTSKELRDICLEHDGYSTPSSTFDVFSLQRNLLSNIENLESLHNLVQLDLSENQINHVSGLACLSNLNTLNLAKNTLENSSSVAHLKECESLTTIDLSDNNLKGEAVIEILSSMSALLALSINGNPVVRETSFFRKKCIAKMKKLKYLDRPVFGMERATSEAWNSGGREAELKTKQEWQEKERRKHQQGLEDFRQWQSQVRETKLKQIGNGPTPEQQSIEKLRRERLVAAEIEGNREREQFALKKPDIVSTEKDEVSCQATKHDLPAQIPELSEPPYSSGLLSGEIDNAIAIDIERETSLPSSAEEAQVENKGIKATENNSTINLEDTKKTSFTMNEISNEDSAKETTRVESEGLKAVRTNSTANTEDTNKALFKTDAQKQLQIIEAEQPILQDDQTGAKVGSMEHRINDSVAIYKARKELGQHRWNEKLGLSDSNGNHSNASTFQRLLVDAMKSKLHDTKSDKPPINSWNDSMDDLLTALVHEKSFNFLEVATSLQEHKVFEGVTLTEDDCRLRWSAIDAAASQENNGGSRNTSSQSIASAFRSSTRRLSYDDLQALPSKLVQKPKDLPNMSNSNNIHDTGTTVLTRIDILNELTSQGTD
eukprot:CAMPEP_0116022782 /NCGR_PEP_ID=MMETSP0321-20121206/11188_1 /TAXON_ID=163516 /ORGANISM="Leptocylindrus danicus var. danicus, Strain B650" /LENGTH=656 /DNA_ID=CAMNT_0003493911 /DNA_START=215 /DNA_END=2184 /DNA_ORIENTATION=+